MKKLRELLDEISEIEDCFDPTEEALKRIQEWLTQKRKEIGDNDEWRAIDLIKELLREAESKPFKAYLRCVAPSEACFYCQHILECRAINDNKVTKGEKKE